MWVLLAGCTWIDDLAFQARIADGAAGCTPTTEVWYDGFDQDCAGDDDFDQDGDGERSLTHPDALGEVGPDCNDTDATVNSSATEVWYDGVDQDCDGLSDNDQDRDGSELGADCDDTDALRTPGSTEDCSTAWDDDCDGDTNTPGAIGSSAFYTDDDGDGFGSTDQALLCFSEHPYTLTTSDDCDDSDALINPDAEEDCSTVDDDDCDGQTNEEGALDCSSWYEDADGDTYGVGAARCQCAATADFPSVVDGDCDDTESGANPGAFEAPGDGVDNDCDGEIDEALTTSDVDGDGYSEASGDCDDTDASINPDATEIWYDGVDEDCDGLSDYDQDLDGHDATDAGGTDCDDTDATVNPDAADTLYDGIDSDCGHDSDYDADGDGQDSDVYGGVDCNDADASINTLATESWYDGVDQDCDGNDDDQDGDGYASDVTGGTDCDDTDASVNPGAVDVVYDGVDQDCDGESDFDADGDGFTSSTYGGTDCDDADAAVNPAATETCDSIDDDCDGTVDDGVTTTYYRDADSDGYGVSTSATSACSLPSGYSTLSTDCNDSSASISPGDSEVCNSVDDDCDGTVDDGVTTTYYQDGDGDGYGNPSVTSAACSAPAGFVSSRTDCDDSSASISPGDSEVCNSVDDDCDGSTDEDFITSTYYLDSDGDGYGTSSTTTTGCTIPSGYVSLSTDCDDADATSNPGAIEIGYDAADNDCDEYSDEMSAETESGWTVRGGRSGDATGTEGVHVEDDLDGDGDPELVICAGSANTTTLTDAGYLGFYDVATAGLDVNPSGGYYLYQGSNSDDFTGGSFGVIGDVDGDGATEFAVGSYRNDSNYSDDGQVYILDAAGASGAVQASASGADGIIRGATNVGLLGYALAAGDFDGDGANELGASAPSEQSAKGRVYVTFYDDGLGWADIDDTDSTFYMTGVSNSDHLGYSVDFGDFNYDGYDDLVACSPDDDDGGTSSGVCWVVNGSTTRDTTSVSGTSVASLYTAKITGSAASDQAGLLPNSLAVGDLDDDGRDDLAVGVSGYDGYTSGGGGVWVYTGGSLSGSETYATANYLIRGDGTLGASVSFGDVTGDGIHDLLAGATTAGTGGRVYLFEGGQATGTYTLPDDQYASWDGEASGDLFGTAISGVRDLDLDGVPDFAVAAPGNDDVASAAGKVYVLPAYP